MTDSHFPILSTSRLRLRAISSDDRVLYQELLSLPDVTRHSNISDAPSEDEAGRTIEKMTQLFDTGTGCAWIIEDRSSECFVGAVRFNYFLKDWKVGGVGYETHPRYWGQGFMTEALRAVVICGHEFFELNRIEAWTVPGNSASDRVLQKVGFRLEGVQRQKGWFKGAFHDFRLFGRVAHDPTI